jgi:CTP:molybdopterin cytidylyltransferase MocA
MNWVIVLAAGRGVRAGGPKALHTVHARPWWQAQHDRLRTTGLPTMWVVSEHVRAAMQSEGHAPKHTFLADDSAPMFASIAAGAHAITHLDATPRGIFVLPVDVPAPAFAIFAALSHTIPHTSTAVAAIPTHHETRGHPVYLRWPFVTSHILTANPAEARLDQLIGDARIEVPVPDASVIVNLNTADDFAAWASRNK